ncbi:MAG: hypothetical protein ACUVSA_12370 [Desulfosoma sp.]|uniref:hypothetical protein n=1 Tax=Desulfosoma sp. TaxID=2603217 RepID=UPI00404AA865
MRIVIDMQGAHTESRFRGIGRYTMSFAHAVVRNRGEHEVILALNGLFPETIEPIRVAFDGLLPQENIRVWHAPGPVCEMQPGNDARREAAELTEALSSLRAALLKQNRSFTAFGALSIHIRVHPENRKEGMDVLNIEGDKIVNVSTAIVGHFQPWATDNAAAERILKKFHINGAFVLHSGSADERKNLVRLIQAYAALPASLRVHQLVLASKMPEYNFGFQLFDYQLKRMGVKCSVEECDGPMCNYSQNLLEQSLGVYPWRLSPHGGPCFG